MKMYIGLDVHSKQTVYGAQDEAGNVVGEGSVPTTVEGFCRMMETLGAPKGTKIGLETGVQATWVSRLLSGLSMEPVVIDAREVRQKARRAGRSVTEGTPSRFATGCVGTFTPRLCTCQGRRWIVCGGFCRVGATS